MDRERKKKNGEKTTKYHFSECLFLPRFRSPFLLSQPPSPYSLSKIGTDGQRRPRRREEDHDVASKVREIENSKKAKIDIYKSSERESSQNVT